MSRQDQYAVLVTIDGEDTGIWDKLTGGEVDSEELKYKPGGMARQISLGGSVNVGNVTVSRLYDLTRDHLRLGGWIAGVGRARVIIKKQPLDLNAIAFGPPVTYTGILKMVTPPEVDSEATDAALVELEVTTDGEVTVI
jgi:hypothetical protein